MASFTKATLLCGIAFLLAGCGGDDEPEGGPEAAPTSTAVVTETVTVTTSEEEGETGEATTTVRTTTSSELSFEGFQTPSRNISCVVALGGGLDPYMRCNIGRLDNPPPRPASCEYDWGHTIELTDAGPGSWACVSDAMVPDSGFVTLAYGSAWERGPFTCHSRVEGVRCTNSEERGFFLSRERQRFF